MLCTASIAKRTKPDEGNGSSFAEFKDLVHGLDGRGCAQGINAIIFYAPVLFEQIAGGATGSLLSTVVVDSGKPMVSLLIGISEAVMCRGRRTDIIMHPSINPRHESDYEWIRRRGALMLATVGAVLHSLRLRRLMRMMLSGLWCQTFQEGDPILASRDESSG